jgi:hypothetical protein
MSTKGEEENASAKSTEKREYKPNFSGVWKHVRSDNLDEFLKESGESLGFDITNNLTDSFCRSGVNWFMRKFAAKSDPIYTIYQEDDVIRMIFSNGGSNRETAFVIDEEYDEVDWKNREMKVRKMAHISIQGYMQGTTGRGGV